ncbi:MAG: transcription antitermination factor NusB [Bacteroidia bacterium]
MISRRALRIRSFQFLFSYFKQNPLPSVEILKKQCLQSLDKSYIFYLTILSLLDEFRIQEINQQEKQKNKFIRSAQDPFIPVFSTHPFFLALKESKIFYQKLNEYKVNFGKDKDWTHTVYKTLIKTDFYNTYKNLSNPDKEQQILFVREILDFLYNNDLVEHFFEEESQFAQDDLYLSINITDKTVDEFENSGNLVILPQYKDEKIDKKFVEDLIAYTAQNYHAFDDYISKYSKNWDLERINYSDLLLIKMCMTELIYMPEIPLKSSVDEYIEISKEYSTPQSYVFINGILVGVIKDLTEKGMIKKTTESN